MSLTTAARIHLTNCWFLEVSENYAMNLICCTASFFDDFILHVFGTANTESTRIWCSENWHWIYVHEIHCKKTVSWAIHSEGVLDPYTIWTKQCEEMIIYRYWSLTFVQSLERSHEMHFRRKEDLSLDNIRSPFSFERSFPDSWIQKDVPKEWPVKCSV